MVVLGSSRSRGAAHRAPLLLSLSIFIFIFAGRAPAGDGQGELRAHYTCCLAGCSWARFRNFAESWAKPAPPGPALEGWGDHRFAPSLPLIPYRDSDLLFPPASLGRAPRKPNRRPQSFLGSRGRGPRPRGRGPQHHLAPTTPTLPALARGQHTHPPHAAGRVGFTRTPRSSPPHACAAAAAGTGTGGASQAEG